MKGPVLMIREALSRMGAPDSLSPVCEEPGC